MMLSSAAVLTPSRIDDGAQQWQPQYIPPGLDLRIFPPVKPSFIGPVEPRHPMPCLCCGPCVTAVDGACPLGCHCQSYVMR